MSVQRRVPLGPEQLTQIKRKNVEDIVNGLAQGIYSDWLLVGTLHEKFSPTVAVAFFPDIFYAGFTPNKPPPEELLRYRKTAAGLILPERILRLEREQYGPFVKNGDQILSELSAIATLNLVPTAIIAFYQPDESGSESAYLMCPTPIPPSAALRFIKENSRIDD